MSDPDRSSLLFYYQVTAVRQRNHHNRTALQPGRGAALLLDITNKTYMLDKQTYCYILWSRV